MTCPLLVLLCLDPAGFYISGSLSAMDSGVEIYTRDLTHITRMNDIGHIEYVGTTEERGYSHRALNPYGRLAIGYERLVFVPELKFSTEIYHESSTATAKDRGVNGVRMELRWHLFGGAR